MTQNTIAPFSRYTNSLGLTSNIGIFILVLSSNNARMVFDTDSGNTALILNDIFSPNLIS